MSGHSFASSGMVPDHNSFIPYFVQKSSDFFFFFFQMMLLLWMFLFEELRLASVFSIWKDFALPWNSSDYIHGQFQE